MKIKCPRGWKAVYQVGDPKKGRITVHHEKVEILEGICDSCDLCGIEDCQFYDTSREATRRFNKAVARRHTLDGLFWDLQNKTLKDNPPSEEELNSPDIIKLKRSSG